MKFIIILKDTIIHYPYLDKPAFCPDLIPEGMDWKELGVNGKHVFMFCHLPPGIAIRQSSFTRVRQTLVKAFHITLKICRPMYLSIANIFAYIQYICAFATARNVLIHIISKFRSQHECIDTENFSQNMTVVLSFKKDYNILILKTYLHKPECRKI